MSDQPKVSERMRQLFKSATKEAFGNGNMFAFPEEEHIPQCSAGDALFSAIAEIEQRAEKFESDLKRLHSGLCCAWNLEYPSSDDTLVGFASRLFERAEKAEQERDLLLKEPENRLDGYRELGTQCAMLAERAEKWKAVALTHVALMQSLSGSVDEINAASKKAVEACKALGDDWDEATR